jgi:hypothetical protein
MPTSGERVRAALATADRRRRQRAASARIWRVAPVAAAALLALAALSRAIGWSPAVPLVALAGAGIVLAAVLLLVRRVRPVSDAAAAAIDTDAGLRGELRSASWFAGRQQQDDWAALHVDRAADRVHAVDWIELYPPVRAPRAGIATSVMVVATIALALVLPGRSFNPAASARGREVTLGPDPAARPLPPDLQKQLAELLAAAEAGTLTRDGKQLDPDQLRDLLEHLKQMSDRQDLKDLAHAMNADTKRTSAQEMKALAERLKKASEISEQSREFQKAVEDLARELSEAAELEEDMEQALAAAAQSEEQQPGAAGQSAKMDEASIQAMKEPQAGASASGMVMMSDQQSMGAAPPGFGAGGAGSATGEAGMPAIEQALRQEMIEASKDQDGANVDSEVRRKTEQGQASVTFTGGSSGKSDRSRAEAPAPVPEARRTNVQRYFTRKP